MRKKVNYLQIWSWIFNYLNVSMRADILVIEYSAYRVGSNSDCIFLFYTKCGLGMNSKQIDLHSAIMFLTTCNAHKESKNTCWILTTSIKNQKN